MHILSKSKLLRKKKRTNVNLKDRFRNLMKSKGDHDTNDFDHSKNLLYYFYEQYNFETTSLPLSVKRLLINKFGNNATTTP